MNYEYSPNSAPDECVQPDAKENGKLGPGVRKFLGWGVVFGLALAICTPASAQSTGGRNVAPPIMIGRTTIMSGPLAPLAIEPTKGIAAYINHVNSSGGVRGRLLELAQLDDGYDPARAAENVRKLVADGAVAILSPIGTASSEGTAKAAHEVGVAVVGPYTGADHFIKPGAECFPLRISFAQEFERIVAHLNTIGLSRIAFVYNDNPGARASRDARKALIAAHGGTLVADIPVAQDGSDAAANAKLAAAQKPNAVILSLTTPVAKKFIPEFKKLEGGARMYSFSFLDGPDLHRAIGSKATGVVVSQVVPSPWSSPLPVVAEYRRAMKAIGSTDLSYGSLEGYLAAKTLVLAIKEADEVGSKTSVLKALRQPRDRDLGGLVVRGWSSKHTGLGFNELSMIRDDGQYSR